LARLKSSKIRIEGNRIYLRNLAETDATQEYCDWLNDPEVNRYLETKKASVEELKQYIIDKNNSQNCLFLGIFLKDGKHIGNLKLEPIDFKNEKGTLGILIGDKEYWGKGLGTEAVKLLVSWAFNNLKLEEVNLGVISENKAAIRVYEKAGFLIDKIEKKSIKHGNKLNDKIVMSIKRRETQALAEPV
jgi:RimJ/RimL family protein N-acetyltransferase